jgi:hypothetical protein
MLPLPVLLFKSALTPMALFSLPVALLPSALLPMAIPSGGDEIELSAPCQLCRYDRVSTEPVVVCVVSRHSPSV